MFSKYSVVVEQGVMEATAIHLVSFCKEVSASHSVWTIHKDGHVPSVPDADGISAMPFWSSRDRAVDFLSEIDDFEGFIPLEIPWALFKTKWVSDLVEKRMVAGVNWTGRGIECEVNPEELIEEIESRQ